MNKYGPGERLNSARYTIPITPARRERVELGTLILIGANRLLDLGIVAFLAYCAYVLVMRWDIVVAVLNYGIR